MHIRDREIDRLKKYATALGVKVTLSTQTSDNAVAASWTTDGSNITIYVNKSHSKTDTILSLIHELGHHLWFIYEKERQPDLKIEEALMYPITKEMPKKLRKKIYNLEVESAKYWDIIVKDVDIKIPKWKIEMAAEFDIWQYEVYYKTAEFPTDEEQINKHKQLIQKYKASR